MRAAITTLAALALAAGASAEKQLAPLPIEEVAAARGLTPVPVDLSSDGRWLAYTADDPKAHPPILDGGHDFTPTGAPMTWGGGKMGLWVTNTVTGETVDLNAAGAMSWGGVWSPDSKRLAFYSDRAGEQNLWVWDLSTRTARRVSDAIARPHFWFELPRWSPDGRTLLCKVLPEGMTLAQAAALLPTAGPRVVIKDWSKPSVFVLSSPSGKAGKDTKGSAEPELTGAAFTNAALADLAVIDVETGNVKRIVRGARPRWFAFSPDGGHVAFTDSLGWEANSQQPVHDLQVYSLADRRAATLVPRIRQGFGISVSWSPDSKRLAYTTGGQRGDGACYLVAVTGGEPRSCSQGTHPSFADDFRAPLWDPAGKNLYFLGAGAVWKTDLVAGTTTELAKVPGRRIADIVAPVSGGRFWSPDGRSLVVTTRDDVSKLAGFCRIDLASGAVTKLLEESKHYGWSSSFDVSDDGRQVVWSEEDAAHPPDYWIAGRDFRDARQATHVAPVFDRYDMGQARLVEWLGVGGQELRGTLLLPAGYKEGTRYPLVAFVYGGGYGSNDLDRFGLWGSSATFNMQVLATRGYAVFSPDAPLAVGTPLRGLADTVLPGINRVVEMGIADADRLAVMGQSYGSYSVLALLVQTTRFKAAVITAIVDSDLLGGYLYMNNDGTDSTGYYEEGQGGMGGTPWQVPARYHDNSPIFFFDKIETPLLMGQGTMDSLPLWWPDSTFVALRRLGKKVEYVMYAGEGHVVLGYANTVDFWNRRLAFLEENLAVRGAEAKP
jgi:dipeptidyl aminopeptidase/acylaminoacyl peptidase